MSRMSTFAREASQAFPHGSIEAFNKRGVQFGSSPCRLKQLLCLLKRSSRHLAGDFDDVVLLDVCDHCGNTQTRPYLYTRSSTSYGLFDFVSKRTFDTLGVGCPPIRAEKPRSHSLATGANPLQQMVCQRSISLSAHHSCQP